MVEEGQKDSSPTSQKLQGLDSSGLTKSLNFAKRFKDFVRIV